MNIAVEWANLEETVILWKFGHRWTTDDYFDAMKRSNMLVSTKPYLVDSLIDMRYTNVRQSNLFQLAQIGHKNKPRNTGRIIILVTSEFLPRMYRHYKQVFPNVHNMDFANTLDEAYEHLRLDM